tara:strand:- start:815 stop:1030 length:216 start_codon:yes stop_codon:yes gene_type:complete
VLIKKKKLGNIAGVMGGNASQPAAMLGQETVDPLERAQQKMAGRTQGGAVEGIKNSKMRPKRTLMTNYGMK